MAAKGGRGTSRQKGSWMRTHKRHGFTLVELLVVIGIIALLIGILLPSLNKARESARTVKCASNLRSIGQGIAQYVSQYAGALPASNFYKGLTVNPGISQGPPTPSTGYVHWSSYIYADKTKLGTDDAFKSLSGWDAFQCPSLDNGGLPPANTFNGNSDGLGNDAGGGVIDWQAPRLAYTVNEALCPRGVFVFGFRGATRPYRFIKAGRVRNSQDTILATEIWGAQDLVKTDSLNNPGFDVSASRRPLNGFAKTLTSAEEFFKSPPNAAFIPAGVNDVAKDPSTNPNAAPTTLIDWVGRNHYRKTINAAGYDARQSNFLYLDGHVETKHVLDTVRPRFQWGDKFYTLER